MPKTDIDSLREFRKNLSHRIVDLRKTRDETQKLMNEVAEGWKDQKFIDFNQKFSEDYVVIEKVCQLIESVNDGYLKRLEDDGIRYGDACGRF